MRCTIRQAGSPVRTSGYTLLELLLVLALLGLFSGWVLHSRPSRVGEAVVALRTQALQARFEAIERNAPVAVVYRAEENAFLTLTGDLSIAEVCRDGEEVARLQIPDFPGVRVKSAPPGGLVWLPSGTGRTCNGAGAFNQTIELADRVREGRVIVSRAGRVRSEVGL